MAVALERTENMGKIISGKVHWHGPQHSERGVRYGFSFWPDGKIVAFGEGKSETSAKEAAAVEATRFFRDFLNSRNSDFSALINCSSVVAEMGESIHFDITGPEGSKSVVLLIREETVYSVPLLLRTEKAAKEAACEWLLSEIQWWAFGRSQDSQWWPTALDKEASRVAKKYGQVYYSAFVKKNENTKCVVKVENQLHVDDSYAHGTTGILKLLKDIH